jgi:hypothetical protein
MSCRSRTRDAEWLQWFKLAEDEYESAREHEISIWICEGKSSEAYLEAIERVKVTYWRWSAALAAYNAYMDAQAKLSPEPHWSEWGRSWFS